MNRYEQRGATKWLSFPQKIRRRCLHGLLKFRAVNLRVGRTGLEPVAPCASCVFDSSRAVHPGPFSIGEDRLLALMSATPCHLSQARVLGVSRPVPKIEPFAEPPVFQPDSPLCTRRAPLPWTFTRYSRHFGMGDGLPTTPPVLRLGLRWFVLPPDATLQIQPFRPSTTELPTRAASWSQQPWGRCCRSTTS